MTPESKPILLTQGETAVIGQIAVLAEHQGQGVGTLLLDAIVNACLAENFTQIFAQIAESSVQHYTSAGWTMGNRGSGWAWIERGSESWSSFLQGRGKTAEESSFWSPILAISSEAPDFPFVAMYQATDHPVASSLHHGSGENAASLRAALRHALSEDVSRRSRVPATVLKEIDEDTEWAPRRTALYG